MIPSIQTLILLLIVIAALAVAEARLRIPSAILLVLAGIVLGLIPGLPTVELAPELVLLLVLPPIIYSSAVAMSWREFRFNLRPISLLALGCVAFVVGEIAWGLGVGWLMLRLRRWVGDPRIEITLSIITSFLAYWPPEHLGGSGVLATVTAGLYISWNGLQLISAATRLQGIFFWDFLIYLVEGLIFLTTGLQARTLIARIGQYPLLDLAISAAVISAVVIVARFVWRSEE